ncbi:sulfatase-like hydrolase/transferase [Algibacter lectus]|uniref:sulfatase-like hydrolase/transferase n=1 Tax=Algibacter lectus TaxID=221126 RepID=UPI0026EFE0C8|nr:sulfatase-like hydrolase/transferase [Algibacter lectus]MDO7135552.1 sulfatase-like hydrolase/transferase [Algibacter lectus]
MHSLKQISFIALVMLLSLMTNGQSKINNEIDKASEAKAKPNIIFLMTDDQRWDNMGVYGKPEFNTPNIDKLAAEGVVFDQAFYAVAICMPSRVTMLTGRYNSNHRVSFVAPDDYTLSQNDFSKSYPALLKNAGYRTGFIGKVGFTVTDEATRPSMPKEQFYKEHMGGVFDFFAGSETRDRKGHVTWPEEDVELKNIYKEGRQNSGRTLRTGEAMMRFIDTQPEDQPFCLSVSFYAVKHDNDKDVYMPHFEQFKETEMKAPDNWVEGDNPVLPTVVKENARGVYLHKKRSSTPEMYQRLVRRFATQGYTVDEQVGFLVKKLKEKNMLENTVIIYTSDNGRFQGSHGLFDKCLLYDESVKAPLIIYDGRMSESKRQRREKALISSVDMAPTIVSMAGLEVPNSMQGRDISDVLSQTEDMSQWRDTVFMEDLFLAAMFQERYKDNVDELNQNLIENNKSYRSRGVRTEQWKYIVYYEHTPKIEELYDVIKDPSEQNNLVRNLEYTAVLEKLRAKTEEMYQAAIHKNN